MRLGKKRAMEKKAFRTDGLDDAEALLVDWEQWSRQMKGEDQEDASALSAWPALPVASTSTWTSPIQFTASLEIATPRTVIRTTGTMRTLETSTPRCIPCTLCTELWRAQRKKRTRHPLNLYGRDAYQLLSVPWTFVRKGRHLERMLPHLADMQLEGAARTQVTCRLDDTGKEVQFRLDILVMLSPQPPSRRLSFVLQGALAESEASETASPSWLYATIKAPSLHAVPDAIQHPDLKPTLLPFQRKTVHWMLEREGVSLDQSGKLIRTPSPLSPLLFRLADQTWISPSTAQVWDSDGDLPRWTVKGSILAEEMGLGKTVEFLSVILLNSARERAQLEPVTSGPIQGSVYQPVGATLIVAPIAILSQWHDEIKRHCPKLNVFSFKGTRHFEKAFRGATWVDFAKTLDIVLCDYNTLRQELHFATPDSTRSRRFDRKFRRPTSPLVQVEWWRVGMDEVQMVENANSVKELMSLIPRVSCWAISGTPIKKNLEDLQGVLGFLQCDLKAPVAPSNSVFKRMLEEGMAIHLERLLHLIATRSTKTTVRNELQLPRQERHLVPLQLSEIERSYYSQQYEDACKDLEIKMDRLDQLQEDEIEPLKMQSWFSRLRQIICHPQVAERDRRQLIGAGHHQMIKSVDQVLKTMMNQNQALTYSKKRALLQVKIRQALIVQHDERTKDRLQIVLPMFLTMQAELKSVIHKIKSELQKRQQDALAESTTNVLDVRAAEHPHSKENDEISAQNRLRDWLETQHTLEFLLGNLYFQLGEAEISKGVKVEDMAADGVPQSAQNMDGRAIHESVKEPRPETQWTGPEKEAYDFAEVVRREYLKSTEEAALAAMEHMKSVLAQGPGQYSDLEVQYLDEQGGIYSHDIVAQVNDTLDHMTEAAETIWNWRGQGLVTLLCRPFVHQDDPDGEEYQKDLDTQEDLSAYLDVYPQLLADRRQLLTGELSHLTISNEQKSPTKRTVEAEQLVDLDSVKRAKKAAAAVAAVAAAAPAPVASPKSIRPDLLIKRRQLKNSAQMKALRQSMLELRSQASMAVRREEVELCQRRQRQLNTIIHEQTSILEKLNTELEEFQKVFNLRALYFKQLQVLSDEVQGLNIKDFDHELNKCKHEVTKLTRETNAAESRGRYLDHLNRMQNQDYSPEDRQCGICYSTFEDGVITPCAHIFCANDFQTWTSRNRACPICKSYILPGSVSRINFNTGSRTGSDRVGQAGLDDFSLDALRTMSQEEVGQIGKTALKGSWGTKIDMLIRHIKTLKAQAEPGSGSHKSIIYSTWNSALVIVQMALSQNGIEFVRLGQKSRFGEDQVVAFQSDPSIDVFILHARTQSAGLTLTAAKYVFLLEPMLQPMHELQAIGRTHRIGQDQPTHVFQYFCPRTVDSRIVHLAHYRGHSLFAADSIDRHGLLLDGLPEASVNELLIRPLSEESGGGGKNGQVDKLECAGQGDLPLLFFEEKLRQLLEGVSPAALPSARQVAPTSEASALESRRMKAATAAEMRLARTSRM